MNSKFLITVLAGVDAKGFPATSKLSSYLKIGGSDDIAKDDVWRVIGWRYWLDQAVGWGDGNMYRAQVVVVDDQMNTLVGANMHINGYIAGKAWMDQYAPPSYAFTSPWMQFGALGPRALSRGSALYLGNRDNSSAGTVLVDYGTQFGLGINVELLLRAEPFNYEPCD